MLLLLILSALAAQCLAAANGATGKKETDPISALNKAFTNQKSSSGRGGQQQLAVAVGSSGGQ